MHQKSKEPIYVLLMGMTGSGKSSFINTCVNLAARRKFDDARLLAIPASFQDGQGRTVKLACNIPQFQNLNVGGQKSIGESDTKTVNFYDLDFGGFRFTLIDTPGFNDTRGTGQDQINARLVMDQITAVAQIHAIVWVSKSSENRMSAEIKYCIELFQDLLPKSCEKNLFVVFTHVGNALRINAQQILGTLGMPVDNFFAFDNSCLMPKEILLSYYKEEFNKEELESEVMQMTRMWGKNQLNFSNFIDRLKLIIPVSSLPIQLLYYKKRLLEKMIVSLGSSAETNVQQSIDQVPDARETRQNSSQKGITVFQQKPKRFHVITTIRYILCCFPCPKTEYVEIPEEEYISQKKVKSIRTNEKPDLNDIIKEKTLAGNTEMHENESQKIQGPIAYLERLIQQETSGTSLQRVSALEIINNRIFILQHSKEISAEEKKQTLMLLEESRVRIIEINKLLNGSASLINTHTIKNLISCLQEVTRKDEELSSAAKLRADQLLVKMNADFANSDAFNQFDQSNFNRQLNQLIHEVYIQSKPPRRPFVV